MNKRTKVSLGIGLIVVALGALMALAMSGSRTYYMTLAEVLAQPASRANQQLRVNGRLIGSSVSFDPETVMLKFQISEGKGVLPVVYNGVRPGNFEDNIEVLVEGKFKDGVFTADNVLTKCPSKYEAKAEEQEQQK